MKIGVIIIAAFLVSILGPVAPPQPAAANSPPGLGGPEKPGVGWEHAFANCLQVRERQRERGNLRDPSGLSEQFTDARTNCDHYWQGIDVIGHPPDFWQKSSRK